MFFNLALFSLLFFTRFWGLGWGNGFFFHPDENNMAAAVAQLSPQNLSPHFFAYGQFPLYLAYYSLKALNLANTFTDSVYALRLWSAVFSCLSLLFFYLLFRSKIFLLLLIFTPSLIQLAHFGTTESLLVLVFAVNLYLSQLILKNPRPLYFFFVSLITGIGLAAKISSLIFLTPLFFAVIFTKSKNKFHLLLFTIYCLLFTLLFFLLFSPYTLLANSDFLSTLRYETQVATGAIKVFYTHQFLPTTPYLFQLTHIFPYAVGLPMFIFSCLGLLYVIRNTRYLILLVSVFVYFLYFGQLYAKWTRFMSPIFFIFPFLTAYLIEKNKKFTYLNKFILIISILPGIWFMKLYFFPDVRLTASNWITQNIPSNSTVLSEAGNVINLPITDYRPARPAGGLQITNFDFYNYNPTILASQLANSDYIFIPSRRVFKNYNLNYYQHLFSGSLGFTEIKKFSVFNDESAEETWSVFDHPVIRIYQKTNQLDLSQYEAILKS